MTRRWRPSLGFVLGGALLATLGFAFFGLVALRYLGPVIGFRAAALLLAGVILVLTGALGWLLVRLLLRPITALEQFAAQVADGAAATVPRHFGTAELHRTARAVIAMADTLRDRAATIRSFTDHVTHEIKTPVSAIRAGAELLGDGTLAPQDRAILAQIDGARQQIETQLQALRDAAQAREVRYLGQTSLGVIAARLTVPGLDLQLSGSDVALPMAGEGLVVVLSHLLRNAAEQGAGKVAISAAALPAGQRLTVADDGPGISAGNAGQVFDPFFTTRRAAGGTGMGLSIVRNMLAAHRGTITLHPSPQGALFQIDFRA
ncbi:MAG: HAMP domain-containing histidine kinase [Rhodobacteraceae bacterium]|jgi:two-component system, OmpR family, sensor kinase|nr:HAMP domain-containing histidine kinase [Paracoccaceae bacterium]